MSGQDLPEEIASLIPVFTPGPLAGAQIDSAHSGRGGKVHNFHGMAPASAARMVERIETRRGLTLDPAELRPIATHSGDSALPGLTTVLSPAAKTVPDVVLPGNAFVAEPGAYTNLDENGYSRPSTDAAGKDTVRNPNDYYVPPATPAAVVPDPSKTGSPATAPKPTQAPTAPVSPTQPGRDTPTDASADPSKVAETREPLPERLDPDVVRLNPVLQQFYNFDGSRQSEPEPAPRSAPESTQQAYDELTPGSKALVEQTMSGMFTFEHTPATTSPAAPGSETVPHDGPVPGPRPIELVTGPDGSDDLVLPVQGPKGLSHIVFSSDGNAVVIDPDGTRTPVDSEGIAPAPLCVHANEMFDPISGQWIQPPPQTPQGLAPEARQSPWREGIESALSTPADTTTARSPEILARSNGSTEIRTPRGGSDAADRPWVDVRVIDAQGREIAHYREGSDGNKNYPLGAGHSVTIGPGKEISDPPHLDRSPLDSLSLPDRDGKIGFIEPNGWTTALEPLPLPAGVPGEALYAHNGRLFIRDINGKYHWADATPDTPAPTPLQRSILMPWDNRDTNSYQGPDGTWYFNVNGHKVPFSPDQKQIIDPTNGLRPSGSNGIYVDDRQIGPQSVITAAFPIPSTQLPVPAGVPAAALFELEDGRLVIIDNNGGSHYVSPLPALPKEEWLDAAVRIGMDLASVYGGRRGGWANPKPPPFSGGRPTRSTTRDDAQTTFGKQKKEEDENASQPEKTPTELNSSLHIEEPGHNAGRPPVIGTEAGDLGQLSVRSVDSSNDGRVESSARTGSGGDAEQGSEGLPNRPQRWQRTSLPPPNHIDDATTPAEVEAYLFDRHGVAVYGLKDPGLPVEPLAEMARAIDDVVARYPDIELPKIVGVADEGPRSTEYALTRTRRYTDGRVITVSLTLNLPKVIVPLRMVLGDPSTGWNLPGDELRPYYITTLHELGHVLDNQGSHRARSGISQALQDYFVQNVAISKDPYGQDVEYREWIRKLSSYSFRKGSDKLIGPEALAEAFADVEMNGPNASEPAKVLHRLLIESRRHP
ncbi:hypothetical protein ACIBCN_35250 [Nocardia sp. NPDC051052]|uniref:hypothetical protein n=1 Tax=Nocardia sp. NPDC051052 TaxID=3364322 RepID=UPI0037ACF2A5